MKTLTLMLAALVLAAALDVPAQAPPPAEPPQFLGMLEAHNAWRRKVGSPDLVWSADAARQAQAWADQLSRNDCQMKHNPDSARRAAYGENIYQSWNSRPYDGYRRDPATVVGNWGEEQQYYDEASNRCNAPKGEACGHFTQVVWSDTTAVGCGRARCEAAEVWVCNYSPRGNWLQERPYVPGKPPEPAPEAAPPAPNPSPESTAPTAP